MGVEGAAIATVVSQLFSGLLCTWWFFTRVEGIHFTRENCVLSAGHCGRLAYIGLPMGFEYSVSAIGAFIMQDAINLLGSNDVAAQTAGEKIRQMFTVPMASVGTAMATYVGQNHGAHRTDRVRQGIRDGCILQLCYCAAAWVVLFFVKDWAVGLVLGDADPAVTSGAVEYLTVISVLFCINGLLMVFRNTCRVWDTVCRPLSPVWASSSAARSAAGWPFIVWATSASALPTPLPGVWHCSTVCSW